MDANSRIGTTEAAAIAGCSSRRIQKMIKDGTLSAMRDGSKKYWIELSEFHRVFPDAQQRTNSGIGESVNSEYLTQQIKYLTQQNSFLMGQIEFMQQQLDAATQERKMWLDSQPKLFPPRRKFLGIF